jgi:transposase
VFVIFWEDWVMAKGYRPVRRDQLFLLPPDMREWLPADHPVWLVIAVVADHLDTSAAHAVRRTGGAGTCGYDPDMLVTLLVWAYAQGVTSSRRIEAACRTDVAFKVICAGDTPDHVTIARFRAGFGQLAQQLFTQVLVLCARLGMGKLGTVALDGMKIAASASKSANRSEDALARLAAEAAAAHGAADAAEDALFGEGRRGDEVPADAWHPRRRDERIAAALKELEDERVAAERAAEQALEDKTQAHRQRRRSGRPPGLAPAGSAVTLAEENLAKARAQRAAQLAQLEEQYAAGQPRRGRKRQVDDYCRVREAAAAVQTARARQDQAAARAARKKASRKGRGPVRNITDPDSRLMPVRGGGFIQGYNPQNLTSEDLLIIATRLTQDTTDTAWLEPMMTAAAAAAALITAARPPAPASNQDTTSKDSTSTSHIGLLLADAGYLSEHNLTLPGPDRLIATGKRRRLEQAARTATTDTTTTGHATTAMAARLATPQGIAAYRRRGHIAETPHGHIKHNMRFRQLTMRGTTKATAEWTFTATVHNLLKAITTGHLTTHTLATLTS